MVREAVELQVSLKLIWMFKNFFTLGAFSFFLCEVYGYRSCAQEPFVFPYGLSLFMSLLVFQVVLLLLTYTLFFNTVFLFSFPLFLRVVSFSLLFGVQVVTFLWSLCLGFFHRYFFLHGSCYVVLTLDVLLNLPLCSVSERTLRAHEQTGQTTWKQNKKNSKLVK